MPSIARSATEGAPAPDLRPPLHFLVPSFVDTTHFTPATPEQKSAHRHRLGIPNDAFVIGCVAALDRHHKRLDALIDEVATLSSRFAPLRLCASSSPHLLLAGATTDDTAFIEHYAHDQLGSNVTILKDQPFDSMPAIYQSMDLYVHTAPEEVFGICFLEAMSCGIPVVAHHCPRLEYVVGEGGWLVDVLKKGFLAEQWPVIEEKLPAASLRSRGHVEANFSWQAVYEAYMNMYRDVLDRDM